MVADHFANVFGVRNVQRRVNLVQNVEGCGLELEHGQDQRQSDQRALAPGQFGQRVLVLAVERNFDLQTAQTVLAVRGRDQFRGGTGQKGGVDGAKILKN